MMRSWDVIINDNSDGTIKDSLTLKNLLEVRKEIKSRVGKEERLGTFPLYPWIIKAAIQKIVSHKNTVCDASIDIKID